MSAQPPGVGRLLALARSVRSLLVWTLIAVFENLTPGWSLVSEFGSTLGSLDGSLP